MDGQDYLELLIVACTRQLGREGGNFVEVGVGHVVCCVCLNVW